MADTQNINSIPDNLPEQPIDEFSSTTSSAKANRQKTSSVVGLGLFALIAVGTLATYLLSRGSLDLRQRASRGTGIPSTEPNALPINERPYIKLSPSSGREVFIELSSLKKPASNVKFNLTYKTKDKTESAVGALNIPSNATAITSKTVLLGTQSSRGAITYHDGVVGGTLSLGFSNENNKPYDDYSLMSEWRYYDNKIPSNSFSSMDGKFSMMSGALFHSSPFIIVYQNPGIPDGQNVPGPILSGPYTLTTTGEIPMGSVEVQLAVPSEREVALYGWSGVNWVKLSPNTKGQNMIRANVSSSISSFIAVDSGNIPSPTPLPTPSLYPTPSGTPGVTPTPYPGSTPTPSPYPGVTPRPTPTPMPQPFSNLRGTIKGAYDTDGKLKFTGNFAFDSTLRSSPNVIQYLVNVSTTSSMSSPLSAGVSTRSPVVVNKREGWPQSWCNQTLYWRVFTGDNRYYSNSSPVKVECSPKVSKLSATLNGRTDTAIFNFETSTPPGSIFAIDVSTDINFSQNMFPNFSMGTTSPIVEKNPRKWTGFTCGKTVYWRLRDDENQIKTEMQPVTIVCPPKTPPKVSLSIPTPISNREVSIVCSGSDSPVYTYQYRYRVNTGSYVSLKSNLWVSPSETFRLPVNGMLEYACRACASPYDTSCSAWTSKKAPITGGIKPSF